MPKNQSPRIIDVKRGSGTATGSTLAAGTGSGGGTGGVVAANAGLGLYYSAGTLNVGAGSGLTAAADSIAVGAGTLLTVDVGTVGITAGAAYQFIGTGSGTAAAWQNLSGLAGSGLTHTIGILSVGAGNGLTAAEDSIAVGAGAGITVNADDVALTTPGTLSISSTNVATGNHTHDVTASSNPGAAAALLESTSAGGLTLVTATATTKVTTPLIDTASGGMSITPVGDLTLDPGGSNVLPGGSIQDDLGDYNRKWRTLYAAELYVETLVAQDVLATIGGRVMVAPTTKLIADVSAGATTIDVEHNNLSNGGYVYLSTAPGGIAQVEVMKITSGASSITGGYRYSVTRAVDGSPANAWVAGDAVAYLGDAAGEGWLDLTSTQTVLNHLGPTMTVYVRTNTTSWNGVKAVTSIGNLSSFVDYGDNEFGFAAGNDLTLTPTTGFSGVTIDRTYGIRLFSTELKLYNGSTNTVYIQPDGDARFGSNLAAVATTALAIFSNAQTYNSEALGAGDIIFGDHANGHMLWDESAGQLKFRDSTTTQILIDTDGILKATNTKLSAIGLSIKPEILTVTTGTPEPSATPDSTPTATNYLFFPDPAASWYYNYLGANTYKNYAGGDTGRVYGYVEHIVPETEDIGFWKHKSWLVLAAREPTLPSGSGAWASEIYADADIFRPRDVIRAGSSSGLQIQDDAGNLGIFIEDGGFVGIGTAVPAVQLHVAGSVRGNSGGNSLRIDTGSGYLDIGPANTSFAHLQTDRASFYFNKPLYVVAALYAYSGHDLTLGVNGNAYVTIEETTGFVGIGDTTPSYALDVADTGGVRFVGAVRSDTCFSIPSVSTPATSATYAVLYVDSSDGDLKVKFSNGTVKTLTAN